MLTLIPDNLIKISDISCGTLVTRTLSPDQLLLLEATRIITSKTVSLVGVRIKFSPHITAAANFLRNLKYDLPNGWHKPYLITSGAHRLHSDIMDREATIKRNYDIFSQIKECNSAQDIAALFIEDYNSEELRCDAIDLALRAAKYSQNEISVDLLTVHSSPLKLSDSIGFLIRKAEDLENILGNVEEYIKHIAHLVWQKSDGKFSPVSDEDFFKSRLQTYYANAYVSPERYLLDASLGAIHLEVKRRASVLPKISCLPPRYHMSVVPSRYCTLPNGTGLFITTISTPEERHHKHKEFSGKVRGIRYDYKGKALIRPKVIFLAIVDGFWTDDQLGMMANAGWVVSDWESYASKLVPLFFNKTSNSLK